jgi:undecaprenyl-diphosphatase
MGVVLWSADVMGRRKKKMDNIYLGDAILIGLSQALAIIPGVSRSGATITTGRILGIERQDAANFSFLMATPIIAGAGLHEMPKIMHGGINGIVVAGFVSSAVFSLIAIAALISFVRSRTYKPFAWYRIAIAIFVAIVYLSRNG